MCEGHKLGLLIPKFWRLEYWQVSFVFRKQKGFASGIFLGWHGGNQ